MGTGQAATKCRLTKSAHPCRGSTKCERSHSVSKVAYDIVNGKATPVTGWSVRINSTQ
jgi:hypothetical protein